MTQWTLIFLLLLGTNGVTGVTHTLKYFYTASPGVSNLPEFLVVGQVDDVQITYYDSYTKRTEPKQDWMKKFMADYPQYREKDGLSVAQQIYNARTETAKQQTEGLHVFQSMYGCEWDDETDEVNGYYRNGYDGENFITFDLKTKTWIDANSEAFITKQKLDSDKALADQTHIYLTQICPKWLKEYLNYGRISLQRRVRPSVSLLQTSPSSPFSCHATGFYPDRATMFWRKDGEDLHEDVDHGEILPNQDGTFQMTVDLDISSVKPEDWTRYDCVFQLYGVKDDIITKLDKSVIRTIEGSEFPVVLVVGVVVGLILLAVCIAGFLIWRGRNNREQQEFKVASSSDTSSENSQDEERW